MSPEQPSNGSEPSIDSGDCGSSAFLPAMQNAYRLMRDPKAGLAFAAMIAELPAKKRGKGVGYFAAEFPFACMPLFDHYVTIGETRRDFKGFALLTPGTESEPFDPFQHVRSTESDRKSLFETALKTPPGVPTVSEVDARAVLPPGTIDVVYPFDIWKNKRQRRILDVNEEEFAVTEDACRKLVTHVWTKTRASTRNIFGYSVRAKERKKARFEQLLEESRAMYRFVHDSRTLVETDINAEAIGRRQAVSIRTVQGEFASFRKKIAELWDQLSEI